MWNSKETHLHPGGDSSDARSTPEQEHRQPKYSQCLASQLGSSRGFITACNTSMIQQEVNSKGISTGRECCKEPIFAAGTRSPSLKGVLCLFPTTIQVECRELRLRTQPEQAKRPTHTWQPVLGNPNSNKLKSESSPSSFLMEQDPEKCLLRNHHASYSSLQLTAVNQMCRAITNETSSILPTGKVKSMIYSD